MTHVRKKKIAELKIVIGRSLSFLRVKNPKKNCVMILKNWALNLACTCVFFFEHATHLILLVNKHFRLIRYLAYAKQEPKNLKEETT